MAFDYSPFIALAQELISEYGREVTVQQLSGTVADPDKPWEGAGVPTVAQAVVTPAAFVPATGSGLGRDLVPEELLARVAEVALVPPGAVVLEQFNCILDTDGSRWNVDWCQVLKPANDIVLYVFGVKR